MKKILLISLLLFSKIAFSQVSDHFNDGDFSQNPVWIGDVRSNYSRPDRTLPGKPFHFLPLIPMLKILVGNFWSGSILIQLQVIL
jgi:hypothetical protein